MSSHHFVREDQEPALLVYDFHITSDHYLLGQLLEWSPHVFADVPVAERLLKAGFKVDTILYNTLKEKEKASALQDTQRHITLNQVPGVASASGKLSVHLQHIPQDDINVLNPPISSLPDLLRSTPKGTLALYWDKKKAVLNNRGKYRKWLPEGTRLEVGITAKVNSSIQVTNLVSVGMEGSFPSARAYRVKRNGMVSIHCHHDFVVLETGP
ncbi:hypothetical protein AB9P05_06780 [Roseivirga sp. BDSF3-8]|uniref:hypothetical protein n=1 Tax=Roseivirga sp. BDSF3-8 TaxID=3241598 RepID=UPI0035323D3A